MANHAKKTLEISIEYSDCPNDAISQVLANVVVKVRSLLEQAASDGLVELHYFHHAIRGDGDEEQQPDQKHTVNAYSLNAQRRVRRHDAIQPALERTRPRAGEREGSVTVRQQPHLQRAREQHTQQQRQRDQDSVELEVQRIHADRCFGKRRKRLQ